MNDSLNNRMCWRRLDMPGTDECTLVELGDGWRLGGRTEFGTGPDLARLRYMVECDCGWRTIRAEVQGTRGPQPLQFTVQRDARGDWVINGERAPALGGLVDLDLGFTPATNLFPIRRLALCPGQSADAEAAWLDDTIWRIVRLPQRYERRDGETYWYEAPTLGYAGLLTITAVGFVREYPGLWSAEV